MRYTDLEDKNKRMLIVDDAKINRQMLKRLFDTEFEIIEAENGEQALDFIKLHANELSVIMLDLVMPVMDGFGVLRELQEDEALVGIPVIVVTGHNDVETSVKAFEFGAWDVVSKPFNPRIVRQRVSNVIGIRKAADLSAENRRLEETRYRLEHDDLTGLYNQHGLEIAVKKALEEAKNRTDVVWAILDFDIGHFRAYNELYGFAEGDRLLKAVAQHIRNYSFSDELYARVSADHFVGLVWDESEEKIFESISEALNEFMEIEKNRSVSATAGLYYITDFSMEIGSMRDKALAAKKSIKNVFGANVGVYNDELNRRLLEDMEMVSNAEEAFERQEFVPYYQPKVDSQSGRIVGAEALVRWIRENGEVKPPNRFIELFEQNGLISRLDMYMLEHICQMLRRRLDGGKSVIPISVNFSRAHLYERDFVDKITQITQRYNVSPSLIEVELTETAFFENNDALIAAIGQLHDRGFLVSIDDFGSGYSSLNMLKDAPVDVLKLDLVFMTGFDIGGRAGTVVTSVMRMARWLGMAVVAEGVETTRQSEFLRSVGCDMLQGYLFSRPIIGEEFEKRLDEELAQCKTSGGKQLSKALKISDIDELLGGNSFFDKIMQSVSEGIGIYELSDEKLEVLRTNDSYHSILGYTNTADFSADSVNVLNKMHQDDRAMFLECCWQCVKQDSQSHCLVRRYDFGGELLKLSATFSWVGGSDQKPLILISFFKDGQ